MSEPEYTIPIQRSQNSSEENSGIEYGYKILNPGEIIGERYQIVKELRSGGFATTYIAKDIKAESETICVVKKLQPRFNSPAIWRNAKERFVTEANVLQWLGSYSQIPQLLAHFEEDQQFYLVQEFIEGEEFEQEVIRCKSLSEFEIIAFLYDVLETLDFVHKQGVIHRDIKPSNLIRRKGDRKIVLIDFGAVKEISTLTFDAQKHSIETQVIGTPGYMAPEQNSGKPLYSSDIYALGRTAIYGLTGRSPIDLEDTQVDDAVTWHRHVKVSSKLACILDKMMHPKAIGRYHSVTEVMDDLKPLLRIGQNIKERYQISSYLGGKEICHTYLVKNSKQDNTEYILKIIQLNNIEPSHLLRIENGLDKTLTEIQLFKSCHQLAQIYEYFYENDELYLVEEYIEGKDLNVELQDGGALNPEKVIDILEDVLETLKVLHKNRFVHGNIKPSNLIRRRSDRKIVLVDPFAIQEIINWLPEVQQGYMPPEQITGKITPTSDLYSLGITAIQALTATPPSKLRKNPETGEVIWQQQGKVSPRIAKVVDKMVRLDSQKRFQSASDNLKALKRARYKSTLPLIPFWFKYLVASAVVGISIFTIRYFWLQYEAILLFEQGDIRLESQQYDKAAKYYDEGLKKVKRKVKRFERAWLAKATALSHLKRYQEMLATCEEALRSDRNNIYFLNCKGFALDGLEAFDRAIDAYDRAILVQPDFFDAWNNRGETYLKQGKIKEAIADFQKAIQLNKNKSFVPLNNLGKLYFRAKEYNRAIDAYEQAIGVNNRYVPAWIGKGNTQRALKQYPEALLSYEQAISLNQDSYEAWYNKGLTQESLNLKEEAIESYQSAIEINPQFQVAITALQRLQSR